ncbi:DUF3108 domain-containing protein [Polaromonas sp. UBA4122]|uniref:DUF3108 domain-containing protein n=1 Tax=Polaromonas sp. UBA4122 TaxID=1947074 RepID=UPI0025D3DB5B|nr:DUF3108 domain-containing protein [Polaromonas sp. UBA4122]
MSTLAAQHAEVLGAAAPRAAPPWRALGTLAVLVLAAHTLVLRTSPKQFGPALDPSPARARAFVTRSIEMPPSAEVSTPPPLAAKPVTKNILKEKEAVAQESRAQSAIDSVAPQVPESARANEPDASASADSVPDPTAASDTADTAMAAASAAGAAVVPPAGPSQTPVTAMALPASALLEYKAVGSAKGLNYYANSQLDWHNAGSTYDARMTVSALFIGSRTLTSSGQASAEGLAPTRFSDKYKTEVAAHFEPEKGQITFSANTPSVPWIKGVQDRVSVFLQLGGMLAGNPAGFPVGSTISMYTVGPRDADTWTFLVEAEEKITLPYGELSTLRLSRQPKREYDQKVEIWYAPSLGYLPVRNKITQHNGDFVDQQLTAVSKS